MIVIEIFKKLFMPSTYKRAYKYLKKHGFKRTAKRALSVVFNINYTYMDWWKDHRVSKEELESQTKYKFNYSPKISIVVPLFNSKLSFLKALIESVLEQTYSNWELCLSDGTGKKTQLSEYLNEISRNEKRIVITSSDKPLDISSNTNKALDIASGEYIAFADHDDLLTPNALYEVVKCINKNNPDLIYTDEDKVDSSGRHFFQPHFKSDFNPDMLNCTNYFCHLVVVDKKIQKRVGYLNKKFNGAQDYDFVLRCTEQTDNIYHIPKILYHWRAHSESTADKPEAKIYAFEAGKYAIQEHYSRLGIDAEVFHAFVGNKQLFGVYRTKYKVLRENLVSIIIPNMDHADDLNRCIKSLFEVNKYKNIEIIIVENNSQEKATFELYKKLESQYNNLKVIKWEKQGFNYSAINNYGIKYANGEYVLLLNNDTEVISPEFLYEMLGYAQRNNVGAVGAKLYYKDGTIQHAGVTVNVCDLAAHNFCWQAHNDPGYFSRACMVQDLSCVTAACLLTKKSIYTEVCGFDENLAVAFNDVDFCLKVRHRGYLIVFTPYAELIHYESKSRGKEDTAEKKQRFSSEVKYVKSKWKYVMSKCDQYYNKNLTQNKTDFSLRSN